jgi:hypothetical protein
LTKLTRKETGKRMEGSQTARRATPWEIERRLADEHVCQCSSQGLVDAFVHVGDMAYYSAVDGGAVGEKTTTNALLS